MFAQGDRFADLFDAVIGADVAADLGYAVGDPIVVAHGLASFTEHDDLPFRVAGVLDRTATPVDRTVLVSLQAIEAIHVDWQGSGRIPGQTTPADALRGMDLTPRAVTAALVGVKDRMRVFDLQRAINEYPEEPLLAVLPGVALQELWSIVGVAETALVAVSGLVVTTALLGMAAMILSGLNERRREMAILRAVGARPLTVLSLLTIEAVLMAAAGAALGMVLLYAALLLARPYVDAAFGLYLPIEAPGRAEGLFVLGVVAAAALTSLLPALRAYRLSLADGMTVRI